MTRRSIALAAGVLALSASVALGSPAGDLDPSFDGDGKLILVDPYRATEVLVQADGKILVVGRGGPATDFVVVRLNPDGSPDAAWGDGGRAEADFGGLDWADAAAIQPDGKVVVAGSSGTAAAIARFDSRGRLDPTFDPAGADGDGKKLLTAVSDPEAVLVQPDGRIVLVGQGYGDGAYEMAIARLTPTGSLDGTDWERSSFGTQALPRAGALTPDGEIVVAGELRSGTSPGEIALARYDSGGKLDKTLGGTGRVTFASGGDEQVSAVLAQPDGKIVVAGTTNATGFEMVVTRFDADGTPDAAWSGDGRSFGAFEGQSTGWAAALQPDGKVVVAGISASELDVAVARFSPTGALDASFGSGGRTTVGFGFIEAAFAVALQPDGRIVAAGQAAGGTPVVRLLADPPPASAGDGDGGEAADRIAPEVGPLSVTHPVFRVGPGPRRLPRGTAFRFGLSEAATVRFSIERRTAGRRCRPGGRRAGATSCARYVRIGAFARVLDAGRQRVAFSGRLRGRPLRRAAYRVVVRAGDAAGNRSRRRTAAFRVVR